MKRPTGLPYLFSLPPCYSHLSKLMKRTMKTWWKKSRKFTVVTCILCIGANHVLVSVYEKKLLLDRHLKYQIFPLLEKFNDWIKVLKKTYSYIDLNFIPNISKWPTYWSIRKPRVKKNLKKPIADIITYQ